MGRTVTPHYQDDSVTLFHGDCLDVLRELPDCSVDAVVTDPPYGLGFMGREWDDLPPGIEFAAECLRVLKPGGHMLAFGGSRTWHRLACAVEDAGFEIRDSIAWLYGSGFPKSLDVSKAIDRTAPRVGMFDTFAAHFWERWQASGMKRRDFVEHFPHYKNAESVMAQLSNWKLAKNVPSRQDFTILQDLIGLSDEWETLIERVEAEREKIGEKTAAIATPGDMDRYTVGGSRSVLVDITAPATPDAERWQGWGTALKPAFEPIVVARKPLAGTVAGNVLAHGTGALNIDGCRVEGEFESGWAKTGSKAGPNTSMSGDNYARDPKPDNPAGRWPANVVLDESQAAELDKQSGTIVDRNGGRGGWRESYVDGEKVADTDTPIYRGEGGASRFFPTFHYEPKAPSDERPRHGDVAHPTVKPLDLMRWLVRLVTPPGGTLLEPFAGSGTTAEACVVEGFSCVAIEREADYLPLIVQRLTKPIQVALDFGTVD